MLETLNYSQFVAVAMTSHFFYHSDPMSELLNNLEIDASGNGIVNLTVWLDLNSGELSFSKIETREELNSVLLLPSPTIDLKSLSAQCDLTAKAGKMKFSELILEELITQWWGNDILEPSNSKNLCFETTREVISMPNAQLEEVLKNVVLPILYKGQGNYTH